MEQDLDENAEGARSFFKKQKKGGKTIEKFYIQNINTYVNKGDDYTDDYAGYSDYGAAPYGYGGSDYGSSGYGILLY